MVTSHLSRGGLLKLTSKGCSVVAGGCGASSATPSASVRVPQIGHCIAATRPTSSTSMTHPPITTSPASSTSAIVP
jgi:hypothetical protein